MVSHLFLRRAREQLESLHELLGTDEPEFTTSSEHVRLRELLAKLTDLEKHTSAVNEVLDQV